MKFHLVNPGTLGEPEVLRALLGPDVKTFETNLAGFEVRRQSKPPEGVWQIIKAEWNDKGHPYPGAWGLVKKDGSSARVGGIEFETKDEIRKAVRVLDIWNFHDRTNTEDAWFRYQSFREGDNIYITELLTDDNLEQVPEDYREEPSYRDAVSEMARQAREYRLTQEGSSVQGEHA